MRALADRIADAPGLARRAWAASARTVEVLAVAGVKTHFVESRGPDGRPWAPHKHARPSGGNKPLWSSGVMMAGCSARVEGDTLVLRANAPGARLHQHGGTVTAKKAGALTIPVTAEAARAGGARHFPRRLFVLPRKGGGPGGDRDGLP